jgi:A/G-specific adenine glycosylase
LSVYKSIKEKAAVTFTSPLLYWWMEHRRDFLWRQTDEAYNLMIAETLLRRTNAPAAHKVYTAFLSRFPTLNELLDADPEEILCLVAPLGLKWRAANMITLVEHLKGSPSIPQSVSELLQLPGIGPYVARAILVNSAGLRTIPVDSNIVRVMCRYFGIPESDSLRRNTSFQNFVDGIIGDTNVRDLNYSLLDLAALVCRPSNPKCGACPVFRRCKFRQGLSQKAGSRTRYF